MVSSSNHSLSRNESGYISPAPPLSIVVKQWWGVQFVIVSNADYLFRGKQSYLIGILMIGETAFRPIIIGRGRGYFPRSFLCSYTLLVLADWYPGFNVLG
jgi:hypothetical protein